MGSSQLLFLVVCSVIVVGASMVAMGGYLLATDDTLLRGAARLLALGVCLCFGSIAAVLFAVNQQLAALKRR